jgi:hypothetical protein
MKFLAIALFLLASAVSAADSPLTVISAYGNDTYQRTITFSKGPWTSVQVQNNSGKLIVGEKFRMVVIDAVHDRHTWPETLTSSHKIKPGKKAWLQWEELANPERNIEITPLKVLFEDGTTWEKTDN